MRKSLREPWFSLVKSGKKTCEGRLNKGEFAALKLGEKITFYKDKNICCSDSNEFSVVVTGLFSYPSFEVMLESEGLSTVLPPIKTIKEGVEVYRQFYSEEDEAKYGVLAICVRVV